jgi:Predicted membrane protein
MTGSKFASAETKFVDAPINYTKVVETPAFSQLLRKKRNFILPLSLFFMAFYFTLPVLTAYTHVLNHPAFASITWAWIFAFAQFVMTWTLCILYTRRAAGFDRLVKTIQKEVTELKGDQ